VIHKVYEPEIRARLGTAAHFCEVVVLKLRTFSKVNNMASVELLECLSAKKELKAKMAQTKAIIWP